eukprot:TRINITY_DN101445_c0_g1_i1.p1 TRINITY_DN101445_c0_g1~~TRINITY_DN101445_c0_g1_i1.p1  ORF type:complete len:380 (-),score=1.07 TRINITY_DN101445_c0_g1_i1:146-1204(-)
MAGCVWPDTGRRRLWRLSWLLLLTSAVLQCGRADVRGGEGQLELFPEGNIPSQPLRMTGPGYTEYTERDVLWRANTTLPLLDMYLTTEEQRKINRRSVILIPGGGYERLAWDSEGTKVAHLFRNLQISAFVLQYRTPLRDYNASGFGNAALMDAQRAVSFVRYHAATWSLDPNDIGVIGFSAGGHMASRLANSEARLYNRVDAVDDASSRPDWAVLVYSAYLSNHSLGIPPGSAGHVPELLSPVNSSHPPAFVMAAWDDALVKPEDALAYAMALRRKGLNPELVMYPTGGHGFGMCSDGSREVCWWPQRVYTWLSHTIDCESSTGSFGGPSFYLELLVGFLALLLVDGLPRA